MADLLDLIDPLDEAGEFPISSGIPVQSNRADLRNQQWPKPDLGLDRLRIGDSIDIHPHHCGGAPLIVTQNIVTSLVSAFKKKFRPEDRPNFTTRQTFERGHAFVRCWRIEPQED